MATLLLLFHPDLSKSHANRALADAAGKLDGVEVVDMGGIYPQGQGLDLDVEVGRLLGAERLILQFPIQWYSTPPLLKAWQDTVLTRMYYIRAAEEGERLRGLPVMVAATAGNEPSAYTAEGINLFALAELLKPLQSTAHRCYWNWTEPYLVYRANKLDPAGLARAAEGYTASIERWRAATLGRPA